MKYCTLDKAMQDIAPPYVIFSLEKVHKETIPSRKEGCLTSILAECDKPPPHPLALRYTLFLPEMINP